MKEYPELKELFKFLSELEDLKMTVHKNIEDTQCRNDEVAYDAMLTAQFNLRRIDTLKADFWKKEVARIEKERATILTEEEVYISDEVENLWR